MILLRSTKLYPPSQIISCTNILRYNTCMSSYPGGRKLSHNGCTADDFDQPDHGFLLLTCSTGPMEWSSGNSYQAEALTNVLRYHTCRSSHPEDRKLLRLFGRPWGPEGSENIGKPSYFNLPAYIGFTLFTPIKGRIDSLTVYIYKAETCTNILR